MSPQKSTAKGKEKGATESVAPDLMDTRSDSPSNSSQSLVGTGSERSKGKKRARKSSSSASPPPTTFPPWIWDTRFEVMRHQGSCDTCGHYVTHLVMSSHEHSYKAAKEAQEDSTWKRADSLRLQVDELENKCRELEQERDSSRAESP